MLSFNSWTNVTPKKHCSFHVNTVLVRLKTLHPELLFSECLQFDYYYCTLCRLTFPQVKNDTGSRLTNENVTIPAYHFITKNPL
jgi:hypothetical protein